MHVLSTEPERPADDLPDRVMSDLSLVLAHRLRGLVASIEGFTDLLADTLFTRDQREMALRILEGTARIERVLSDLQRYGEPVEPVMLPLLVHDITVDLLAPLPEAERARVTVDAALAAMVPLLADPYLLRQALLVLIQNALEATRHEGDVRVAVYVEEATGRIVFDVWNPGHIRLPDPATQVFAPFFTDKAHNLGVGLTLARRVAEAHGGTVDLAVNDPEAGVCFTLQLPPAPEEDLPA